MVLVGVDSQQLVVTAQLGRPWVVRVGGRGPGPKHAGTASVGAVAGRPAMAEPTGVVLLAPADHAHTLGEEGGVR